MEKANVLVIGNSGVGKSTLINAVLGEDAAVTGWGTAGTTKELRVYETADSALPFRVIDSIGFEPGLFKEQEAVMAVRKWCRESAQDPKSSRQINLIWFCVDGTAGKLFEKTVHNLNRALKLYPTVPILTVITKSYSEPDRAKNLEMVRDAFAKERNLIPRLRDIIPVVASTYVLTEGVYAAPTGITELIEATNRLLPEGLQAGGEDMERYILGRKRVLAQSVIAAAVSAGVVIAAVPLPMADAVLLTPTEVTMINALGRIYGIRNNEDNRAFFSSIIEAGTVGTAAKALISALKAIPGINVAASTLNAVIAGTVIAALGEASVAAFEQVYLGKRTPQEIDWLKRLIESRLAETVLDKVRTVLEGLQDNAGKGEILKSVLSLVADFVTSKQKSGNAKIAASGETSKADD